MPTPPERVRVAVYYTDDEGRRLAEQALRDADPDALAVHDGVVEGRVDLPGLKALAEGGLMVDLLDPGPPAPPGPGREARPVMGAGPSSAPDPHSPKLQEFKEQSKYVSLQGERLEVSDRPVSAPDPRIHTAGEPVSQPAPERAPEDAAYHIRLHAPMTEQQREVFVGLGIDLAAYEPPDSYRTRLTREQYSAVRRLSFVRAVERYRFVETVTRDVVARVMGERGETGETGPGGEAGSEPALLSAPAPARPARTTFDCILHRIADRERVTRLIDSYPDAEVIESSYLYIRFSAPPDARFLAAVARLPEVRRLGVYTPPKLLADHARHIVGIDAVAAEISPALTGEGELVAVFDSGIDADHPDLADRIHSVEAVPGATEKDHVGHGTHVAGIIAGTGAASDGKIRGLAPGAKLAIVGVVATEGLEARVLTPANWADLLERAVARGARLINLSTGRGAYGDYDFGSLSLDEFVYHHPDVLVVVSAGNEGSAPEGYVGFRTIFSPATAKNVLTVGASCTDRSGLGVTWGARYPGRFPLAPSRDEALAGDSDAPAALSSRGPTEFDSVKPDLLAPGTYVASARARGASIAYWDPPYDDENYAYLGGTSMAAPVVTGAAAVLREYLRTRRGNAAPSAALLKAILIAAARRIAARTAPPELQASIGFPDFDQGFGRLDLTRILPEGPSGRSRRRLEWVDWPNDSPEALHSRPKDSPERTTKRSRTYRVAVSPGAAEPLRIVLAWTDWPSAGVQNNLYLEVAGPAATVIGNAEHRYRRSALDDLLSPYTGTGTQRFPTIDKHNNVEQIVVESPAAGDYMIRVRAENTPFPPQGYALCVIGELDTGLEAIG